MSDNSTLTILGEELVASYSPILIANYFTLSAAVLVLYDYLLTFHLEVKEIWQGKFYLSKGLFVLNRYPSLIYQFSLNFLYLYKPATDAIFLIFVSIAISGIFILRTFAIYGKSWLVFTILVISAVGLVASTIWLDVIQTTSAYPVALQFGPNTCNFFASSSSIARTARLVKQSREAGTKSSLTFILFRDGIFYYSATFLPIIVEAVLTALTLNSGDANLSYATVDVGAIVNALQIVMVNRLVLNLSHLANSREDTYSRSRTGLTPPYFASNSMLGNLGAPVRTSIDNHLDQDIEFLGVNENQTTDLNFELIRVPANRSSDW